MRLALGTKDGVKLIRIGFTDQRLTAHGGLAGAETKFVTTLPGDDFVDAGLNKLASEELARLEALVQRYKLAEVELVRRLVEAQASVSQQEAEKKMLAAEAKVKEVELKSRATDAHAAAAPGKKLPGWFGALLTLNRAGETPDEAEPLESRLIGEFSGWSGKTVFSLEDGTRWRQQNAAERYVYTPSIKAPKVRVRPATFSGFWMEFEGISRSVRVVLVDLADKK